jgi:hypothetical protein
MLAALLPAHPGAGPGLSRTATAGLCKSCFSSMTASKEKTA